MRERRGLSKIRWMLVAGVFGVTLSADLQAAQPRVRLGEVKAEGADVRVERKFRALLLRELDGLTLESGRKREAYVLSASLVRLEAKDAKEGARATCVVSTTLRRAESGSIVAMMRGRGTAEDEPGASAQAVDLALEAAVHGAVVRVPEAI